MRDSCSPSGGEVVGEGIERMIKMFMTSKAIVEKYDYLEAKFRIGYNFLERDDLAELPVGVIELEQGLKVQVQEYTTIHPMESQFETHEKNFDIQYIISGREAFGIVKREGLEVSVPYNEENDIVFYKEPMDSGLVILEPGDLIVVAPEDAHKPRLTIGQPVTVKKLVIKVPV